VAAWGRQGGAAAGAEEGGGAERALTETDTPSTPHTTPSSQPAADQRLLGPDGAVLDDGSTLAEAGIANDAVLGLCHRLPGELGSLCGWWMDGEDGWRGWMERG
jgi:hypothetical protein